MIYFGLGVVEARFALRLGSLSHYGGSCVWASGEEPVVRLLSNSISESVESRPRG